MAVVLCVGGGEERWSDDGRRVTAAGATTEVGKTAGGGGEDTGTDRAAEGEAGAPVDWEARGGEGGRKAAGARRPRLVTIRTSARAPATVPAAMVLAAPAWR